MSSNVTEESILVKVRAINTVRNVTTTKSSMNPIKPKTRSGMISVDKTR